MSTYYCTCRTNYFKVTNEARYQELTSDLTAEFPIHDFSKTSGNGEIIHGFGCYGPIGYKSEPDHNFREFLMELQEILPENEAFLFFESGHEKLQYVVGECTVVTRKDISRITIEECAKSLARKLLRNPNYETTTMYYTRRETA